MKTYLTILTLNAMLFQAQICSRAFAQKSPADTNIKPTIVLVHGAFADGSSWNKVIPIVQAKGYTAIAVQNPLSSLEDDVASVNRTLAGISGKVVLVAHSWGGVVITQAGNNEKIKSLVYVAAYALKEGESVESLNKDAYEVRKIPNTRNLTHSIVEDGFIRMREEAMINFFAQDLPAREAKILSAVQGRLGTRGLSAKVTDPAWKNKPSFYIVADHDKIIAPQLEAEMAAYIGARTFHLPTSHVAMLAKPVDVANIILKAAEAQ